MQPEYSSAQQRWRKRNIELVMITETTESIPYLQKVA